MHLRLIQGSKFNPFRSCLNEWRARRDLSRSAKMLLWKITLKKFRNSRPFWYKLKKVANYPVFEIKNKNLKFKNIRTKFALKMKLYHH
jgi:hypothetical protein